MGCRSDYLEPNKIEINLSIVKTFLDEIKTGIFDKSGMSGMRKDVYNLSNLSEELQERVPELCNLLQEKTTLEISEYSLELQMWWRDHQEADKLRVEKELNELKNKKEIETALDKLTDYERHLLGY